LRDIFDSRVQEVLLIKGHHYENLAGKEQAFRALEKAIVARQNVAFDYLKPEGVKSYASVSPYKLLNLKGIWYLAALDGDKLKTFSFTKIEKLKLLDATFAWSKEIDAKLATEDGIWFTESQHEVVLKVSADVAGYFKRRKLIANQVIEKELADGGLLISAKVGHTNQVLPIIRYWMPNIRIISPDSWQRDLEQEIRDYLQRIAD
jgi:predicted DNA-binding transcriptional regulator YafY